MAGKTIKGLTIEIGGDTTKLGKALEGVNKKSRDLSSELGQINKMLKLDPGNVELLAQKQKVLADAVNTTKEKLETLREAEKQVQEQFERGEASEEQVRALQREIIISTKKLEGYEAAAEDTAKKLKELGDNSDGAAKEIDDVADKADEAERETEELGSSLDGTLSTGLKAVTALAAGAAAAIVGCVEASHEYRTEMGKLDVAFQDSGHSSEAAKTTYKELQSVLGETDQAVEASNHLAKLADNEEDLSLLTDALIGAYATFGSSLPVESLAEAANETVKVGQVTGSFADAINWAAKENTDWNKILGSNKKAMTAFEKAIADGEKTEDAYTAALEACTDEQERQELITGTLTKLYGKAATQYKKTNKEVIEANKANEDWNETLAEVGEELSPVVTEVKKFGTELLKNAKEPLKDVASFLGDKVLPALGNLAKWVTSNMPVIKATLAGLTAAIVAYKVATIAAEVAQKGIKGAIMATEIAQKALTLAMSATPWGLAATAIAGVVTAMIAMSGQTEIVVKNIDVLTEEEKALMEQADKTAESFREQQKATEEAAGNIQSQMDHVTKLKDELLLLADSSGKVTEKDQARAQFILGELNEALGTEYEMTDGIVQKYEELKNSIDQIILAKTANALLEANNADYIAAMNAEGEALSNISLKEEEYRAAKDATKQKAEEVAERLEELREEEKELANTRNEYGYTMLTAERGRLEAELKAYEDTEAGKKEAWEQSLVDYNNYHNTVLDYREAQQAALEGDYNRTVELLEAKGNGYLEYSEDVDQATRDVIDSLYKEAVNAGLEAARTKREFEKGVGNYTQEMVDEAEQGYADALDAFSEAYADAQSVGGDLGGGLEAGMENKRSSLVSKAKSLVNGILAAMRQAADSHSPSKETEDFGEDMGEGTEIGMENKTKDILQTARNQVRGILSAYKDEGDSAPAVMRNVSNRALSRSSENFQTFINGNNSKLDQILAAIKAGQVILLDGNQVVGGTSDRMDNALGQRRALVERGAL